MSRIIEDMLLPLLIKMKTRLRPGATSARLALSALPDQLLTFSHELLSDSNRVESDFLKLGRGLQNTYQDASSLVRFAQDTVVMVNGDGDDDEGLLTHVERVVQDALTALHSCRAKVCQDVGSFARGAELMGDLYNLCRIIDQMVLELGMVGLNIGVESSRSREALELFGLVSSDVREMSKKIAGIAENIRSSTLDARDMQLKAHQEISNDIDKMSVVAKEAEETVQEAVLDIKNLMVMSTTAMNQTGEHFREISNCIGNVVIEVQFHDNMHQRIMHITEALEELAAATPDFSSTDASRAHAIIDLQSAQLKQVILEVNSAYGKTLGAFDEIASHVGKLAESISCFQSETVPDSMPSESWKVSGEVTGTFSNPAGTLTDAKEMFSGLHNAIERFKKLLNQGYRLHSEMQQTFDYASSSAKRLSESVAEVRKINFGIHLLALNAIVKASHMGSDGMALEVLAQAVKGLSDQSNGFVSQIGRLLDDITAMAQVEKQFQSETDADTACIKGAFMEEKNTNIMDTYDKINGVSIDIVSRSEALIEAISATREELTFLSDLKDRLDRRLLELETYKRTLRFFTEKEERTAAHETERLKSRYTMIQERIVHGHQGKEADTVYLDEIENAVSAADNDIELFDMPLQESAPAETQAISNKLGDNVELF